MLTLDEVEAGFGPEYLRSSTESPAGTWVHFDSKRPRQAATMRQDAGGDGLDLRVLVIKLACRPPPQHTDPPLPGLEARRRTARETLDIARGHRLACRRSSSSSRICASLHPKRYAEIDHMVANWTPEYRFLVEILDEVTGRLKEVITAEVTKRPKHLDGPSTRRWSLKRARRSTRSSTWSGSG